MNNIEEILAKQPILLFDGECGFCNRSILFFLRREKESKLNFAALSSETGKMLLSYFELDPKIDSMVLIRGHEAYIKTCAALRLTWYMKGLWPLLSVFLIIPPFMRHPIYSLISRNRMKLFGRVPECALLKNEDQARFLK